MRADGGVSGTTRWHLLVFFHLTFVVVRITSLFGILCVFTFLTGDDVSHATLLIYRLAKTAPPLSGRETCRCCRCMASLQELLAPVSVEEFESEYWEQRPLHIQRPYPAVFQGLLGGQDLPALAEALEQQGQYVQAFFERKPCESHGLLRDFYEGGSVVLNRVDKVWAPVGRLCVALRERLHHVFGVMYLTPRGSQAVRAHTDDQDVFVLQLAGCKHWRIYDTPLALPFEHEQLGKSSPLTSESLGEPRMEVRLQAGELLYLPRGVPHEARADRGASSLHLTLTVQTPEQLVERALPSMRLRGLRPLPRTPERRVSRLEAEPWPPELGSGRPQSTRTSRLPLAGRT